jgi:Ca2+-binding EF-hand superfamily protein
VPPARTPGEPHEDHLRHADGFAQPHPLHGFAADVTDAQSESAFEAANPDRDGTVDMKEAAKFGITEKAFKAANSDNDGTLDMSEYATALTMQAKGSK